MDLLSLAREHNMPGHKFGSGDESLAPTGCTVTGTSVRNEVTSRGGTDESKLNEKTFTKDNERLAKEQTDVGIRRNWLPPRDSNPDMLIQSQLSCR